MQSLDLRTLEATHILTSLFVSEVEVAQLVGVPRDGVNADKVLAVALGVQAMFAIYELISAATVTGVGSREGVC